MNAPMLTERTKFRIRASGVVAIIALLALFLSTTPPGDAQDFENEPLAASTETPSLAPPPSPEFVDQTQIPPVLTATPIQTSTIESSPSLDFPTPSEEGTSQNITVEPSPSLEFPEPTDVESTSEFTFTPSVAVTQVPLTLISTVSFDNSFPDPWVLGIGWTLIASNTGFALEANTLSTPVIYPHSFFNVVVQSLYRLNGSSIFVTVRETAFGGYKVEADMAGQIRLYRGSEVVASTLLADFDNQVWHVLRLSAWDDTVTVEVDGLQSLQFRDLTPLTPGGLSFAAGSTTSEGSVSIDDVWVWSSVAEAVITPTVTYEPTVEITMEIPSTSSTVEATNTATATPTPSITNTETTEETEEPTATPTPLSPEPPLTLLLSDNFELATAPFWNLSAGWSIVPTDNGNALATTQDVTNAEFIYDHLANVVVETRFQFLSGTARLYARSSSSGNYVLALSADGSFTLTRGTSVLLSGLVAIAPSAWQTMRLSVIDDIVRVAVNGTELSAIHDDTPLPPGLIGFSGTGLLNHTLLADDFSLWIPSSELGLTPESTVESTPESTEAAYAEILPDLPILLSDTFDSGDLSAWNVGNGWLIAPRPNTVSILPETTPEATVEPITAAADLALQSLYTGEEATPLLDSLNDVSVSFDLLIQSGGAAIALRRSEVGEYRVVWSSDGELTLYRNGILITNTLFETSSEQWHQITASAIGDTLRVAVDGRTVVDFVDAEPLPTGTIAFGSEPSANLSTMFMLDNVIVTGTMVVSTRSLASEMPMQSFFEETFDDGGLRAWLVNTSWTSEFSDNSMAIESRQNLDFVSPVENIFTDVALEMRLYVTGGQAELKLRESEMGSYRVVFDPVGAVNLYRIDQLVQSAAITPSVPWQWRDVRVSMAQNTLQIAVDGLEVTSYIDSDPLPSGRISFAGTFLDGEPTSVIRIDALRVFIPFADTQAMVAESIEFSEIAELTSLELQAGRGDTFETLDAFSTLPYPLVDLVTYTDWEGSTADEEIRVADISESYGNSGSIKVIGRNDSMEIDPAISPDGTQIAFASNCQKQNDPVANFEIYILDLENWNGAVDPCGDSDKIRQLTNTTTYDSKEPVWSPDGTRIAFISNRSNNQGQDIGWRIYVMDAVTGSNNNPPRLTEHPSNPVPGSFSLGEFEPAWSPDGRQIAFRVGGCGSDQRIVHVFAYGEATEINCVSLQVIIDGRGDEYNPDWSPDGQLLAYTAYRESGSEIYLVSAMTSDFINGSPETSLTEALGSSGLFLPVFNHQPSWSPDMSQIAFVSNYAEGGLTTMIHVIHNISVDYNTDTGISVTFLVDATPRTAHGFWIRYGGPDWSQEVTCENYNTRSTPIFGEGIVNRDTYASENESLTSACLDLYKALIFWAVFNESSENAFILPDQIRQNLPPYLKDDPLFGDLYMLARAATNGAIDVGVRSQNPGDPINYFTQNFASSIGNINGAVGNNTDAQGIEQRWHWHVEHPEYRVDLWLSNCGEHPNHPSQTRRQQLLASGVQFSNNNMAAYYALNTFDDAIWFQEQIDCRLTTSSQDPAIQAQVARFRSLYLTVLPVIHAAIFDTVYGLSDPTNGAVSARAANIANICSGTKDPQTGACTGTIGQFDITTIIGQIYTFNHDARVRSGDNSCIADNMWKAYERQLDVFYYQPAQGSGNRVTPFYIPSDGVSVHIHVVGHGLWQTRTFQQPSYRRGEWAQRSEYVRYAYRSDSRGLATYLVGFNLLPPSTEYRSSEYSHQREC